MDTVAHHINENWRIYTLAITILASAALLWLSKYFATKKELSDHKQAIQASLDGQKKALEGQQNKFQTHQTEHYKLRDLVHEIDGHVKHLPSAQESQLLRETMARLEGRLEGMEPLFKQLLNNDNMLLENELRGDKK